MFPTHTEMRCGFSTGLMRSARIRSAHPLRHAADEPQLQHAPAHRQFSNKLLKNSAPQIQFLFRILHILDCHLRAVGLCHFQPDPAQPETVRIGAQVGRIGRRIAGAGRRINKLPVMLLDRRELELVEAVSVWVWKNCASPNRSRCRWHRFFVILWKALQAGHIHIERKFTIPHGQRARRVNLADHDVMPAHQRVPVNDGACEFLFRFGISPGRKV